MRPKSCCAARPRWAFRLWTWLWARRREDAGVREGGRGDLHGLEDHTRFQLASRLGQGRGMQRWKRCAVRCGKLKVAFCSGGSSHVPKLKTQAGERLFRLENKQVDWEIFLQIMEVRLSNRANEGWNTVRIKSEYYYPSWSLLLSHLPLLLISLVITTSCK
jgi:hypothetical protein